MDDRNEEENRVKHETRFCRRNNAAAWRVISAAKGAAAIRSSLVTNFLLPRKQQKQLQNDENEER